MTSSHAVKLKTPEDSARRNSRTALEQCFSCRDKKEGLTELCVCVCVRVCGCVCYVWAIITMHSSGRNAVISCCASIPATQNGFQERSKQDPSLRIICVGARPTRKAVERLQHCVRVCVRASLKKSRAMPHQARLT